ncbi:Uncharacterised protein [Mycobacteroides abscessus subsp. massiliense]|nr:Uncharacterised protein [Mycobacteroides abscessus subsp. massiliense]
MRRGVGMITIGRGQAGGEEFCAPRVPAYQVVDFALRHGDASGEVWPASGTDFGVGVQALADAPDPLHHTVVGGAHQIDLGELSQHLTRQIITVGLLDLCEQREQDFLGGFFLGSQRQVTGALQIADDRHLRIVKSGGRDTHARRRRDVSRSSP